MPRVLLPFRGAADATPFAQLPQGFAPPGAIRNVIITGDDERPTQLRQRPGLKLLFETNGSTPVQALQSVSRASTVTGLVPGKSKRPEDFTSLSGDVPEGNYFLLDSRTSMVRDCYAPNYDTSVGTPPASAVAFDEDGEYYYTLINDVTSTIPFANGDNIVVDKWRASDGGWVTRGFIPVSRGASKQAYSQFIKVVRRQDTDEFDGTVNTRDYILVGATIASYAPEGYVTGATSSLVVFDEDLNNIDATPDESGFWFNPGWFGDIVDVAVRTEELDLDAADGSTIPNPDLIVLFHGTPAVGTLSNLPSSGLKPPSGVQVTKEASGVPGMDFRSGLMRVSLNYDGELAQVEWGQEYAANETDPLYETRHGYVRIVEQSETGVLKQEADPDAPDETILYGGYGTLPMGLVVDRYNNAYVISSNKGWGPNIGFPPVSPYHSNYSVRVFAADGELLSESDFGTNESDNGDIFDGTDREYPTLWACCIRRDASVLYVGGCSNNDDKNLIGIRTFAEDRGVASVTTEYTQWSQNINGDVQQYPIASATQSRVGEHGMATSPVDGSIWVATTRGSDFTDTDGNPSSNPTHLFKLNQRTGKLLAKSDIPATLPGLSVASINAYCVEVGKNGNIVYGTDYVQYS